MSFWSNSDKWSQRAQEPSDKASGDEKRIDLGDLDPVELDEDLTKGPLVTPTDVRIFGKYAEGEIRELMEWSGIFEAIEEKGYRDYGVELQHLSDLDQRIFVKTKEDDDVLIHMRLKLSHFRFRLHPGAPQKKLLYIDWLLTRHPRTRRMRPDRLFPGQDMPGLGIFSQIQDFITNLTLGVGAKGAFNIPEYFHDALLFHRVFSFYDPAREVVFRALIRDLRKHGAREISKALSEGRVLNADNEVVHWAPGEMISAIDPGLDEMLSTADYHTRVVRGLKRHKFRMLERPANS